MIIFDYLCMILSSLKSEWSVWLWKLSSLVLMIIFDFLSSSFWNVWLIVFIMCDQWNFIITFEHVLITKFHLIISDHATQSSCEIERKSEKCEVFIYNCRKLKKLNLKKSLKHIEISFTTISHFIWKISFIYSLLYSLLSSSFLKALLLLKSLSVVSFSSIVHHSCCFLL